MIKGFLLVLSVLMILPEVWAGEFPSAGAHSGYVDDVSVEEGELIEEVNPVLDPLANEPDFNQILFTGKLIKEFQVRYEDFFGRTTAEQNYNTTAFNRFDDLEYGPNIRITAEEDQERRRDYGIFVLRRLTEYHVDEYARTNKDLRQVYEVKKAISTVSVSSDKGYKFNMNYQISSNILSFKLNTPWDIVARYKVFMPTEDLGPSEPEEKQLSLHYPLTKTSNLSSYYREIDGILSLVAEKKVTKNFSTSITGKTFVKPEGESVREKAVIFGFKWVM